MFLGCPDAFTAKVRASQFAVTRRPIFALPIFGAIIRSPLFPSPGSLLSRFMSGAYAPEKKTVTSYAPVQLANLYRDIFVHSNEPIAILDPQGHYLEQNVAHRELLGYSDEELQGKTPAVHMGEDVFSTIAQALASEGEYRGEILSRRKDGEVRHIELSAFATRDDDGSPICYVGIKRDITDRN
jgi:PAS domain S-box-containing protein